MDWAMPTFCSLVAIINVITYNNYYLSLAVVLVEISVLIYFVIADKIEQYLTLYLIALTTSIEFNASTTEAVVYGFKGFEIGGINLAALGAVFAAAIIVIRNPKTIFEPVRNKQYSRYCRLFTVSILISIGMGIITVAANDNNIQNMREFLYALLGEIYLKAIIPFTMIPVLNYLVNRNISTELIADRVYNILFGISVSVIFSYVFNIRGYYGGLSTIMAPSASVLIPFGMLLPIYRNGKLVTVRNAIIIVSSILLLLNNATGKYIIFCVTTFIVTLVAFVNQKKAGKLVLFLLVSVAAILLFLNLGLDNKIGLLLEIKLRQVGDRLNIGGGARNGGRSSSLARIDELINVIREYIDKPYFILLGKGALGSVKDWIGAFQYSSDALTGYSQAQWENGTFYALHETLNLLLISNGLYGLHFMIQVIKGTIVQCRKSFLSVIGLIWYIFFYGYSVTISMIGFVVLMMSAYEKSGMEERQN